MRSIYNIRRVPCQQASLGATAHCDMQHATHVHAQYGARTHVDPHACARAHACVYSHACRRRVCMLLMVEIVHSKLSSMQASHEGACALCVLLHVACCMSHVGIIMEAQALTPAPEEVCSQPLSQIPFPIFASG